MSWWKKARKQLEQTGELSIRNKYDTNEPVVVDHVTGPQSMRKGKGGAAMSGISTIETPRKRKKKGTRAAKAIAAAQGVAWATLSKAQRRDLRLLARAERGSRKAAETLLKRFGITGPTSTFTPATPVVDAGLAKVVIPHAPDASAAASAIDAIRAALARPQAGAGGWRP